MNAEAPVRRFPTMRSPVGESMGSSLQRPLARVAASVHPRPASREEGGADSDLFDHLVGAGEQLRRHVEAERLSGGQIDDEIEFGRLLYRQISRFGTS
jgi:hypothetical protein